MPGYDPFETAEDAWLDEEAAQKVIDFFAECLKHIEGAKAGQPFELELWEQAFVGNLFGWKRKNEFGKVVRRYREALLYVPRKNGKTPLVAGLCNYVLFCDGEAGAQIYSAAAEREQATYLFRHAKGMVEREPELERRAKIFGGVGHRSIVLREDEASVYKVLSADADTKHGGNSHMVIVDELHAQPNRELVDVLQTSMASANRAQPLFINITTADWDRPSICNEKYEYACKVRDGIFKDKSFLPMIYEAKPEDDWQNPDTWRKANPNLGISVSMEHLERECRRAKETPGYENTFKRLHLNMKTASESRWLPMDAWRECGRAEVELCGELTPVEREKSLAGRSCYGGLDLAKTQDVAALELAFPESDGGIKLLSYFWVPEETAEERERKARVPYATWGRQGFMELTPGNQIDYAYIRHRVYQLAKDFEIIDIRFDPWNATQIAQDMQNDGINVVEFRQSVVNFNEPCREFESLVRARKLYHGNHPVLTWMADNVMVKTDPSGNIRPVKPEHGNTQKVDGIVAGVMATAGATIGRERESLYQSQGLTVL